MTDPLAILVTRHAAGSAEGIYSVCSAHPLVLEAAVRQAVDDGSWLLVEATSNQVDQFGGYTGMRPADFRDLVHDLADRLGLPRERLVLGGDHLGPNRWQDRTPDEAMDLADGLVEAYVAAGYTKIHLDCSMSCAGDPTPLGDTAVAERAARLLAVAERTAARTGTADRLSYVIGTEVPVPGGAHETLHALTPTTPEAARATLDAHRRALAAVGMADAWPRVRALVVQPAVEFDHVQVVDYRSEQTAALRAVLADEHDLVFEAHSTDYQTPEHLRDLVRDHWAVLKVGPGLTFALREALFALAEIETEVVPASRQSRLLDVLDERMVAEPRYWRGYHEGDATEQRVARRYSYSDRVRYYWPDPEVDAAVRTLLDNLTQRAVPETLLSQHLPEQYARVRAGVLAATPHELVVDKVRDALRPYAAACFPVTAARTGR
jgi:D-tagatose-1,6-bisphosphate aldolase subunit GatZ/KbaZ